MSKYSTLELTKMAQVAITHIKNKTKKGTALVLRMKTVTDLTDEQIEDNIFVLAMGQRP